MAELSPGGWREFATKRDIDAQRTELRGEMAELRAELRGEMAELRGDFKRELASLAAVIYTNIGCMLGFGGIVLAAVKLA
jgi:hypothetical protein